MMKQLVFVHGRSQEHKDSIALKCEWIAAFREGLAKNDLDLPIREDDIRFPYYGQTLYDLVSDVAPDQVADVIVRGENADEQERAFMRAVIQEIKNKGVVSDAQVAAVRSQSVVEKSPSNWEWVHGILKAIDTHVPLASGTSIALGTNDVYHYLFNIGIRDAIESGVRGAMLAGTPTVVVGHSLGTVVSYNLLRREGRSNGWQVPLFVTLGSPLAVKAIKKRLSPISHPDCVRTPEGKPGEWYNAMDERDLVALYPLDEANFPITPSIKNKTDVDNHTTNRHGIAGYLNDKEVAKRIYDALL